MIAISAAGLAGVEATQHPETLAARAPVTEIPVEPGFPIEYLGVLWDTDSHIHDHDLGVIGAHGSVRFRYDGKWGPWIRLIEDGVDRDGLWASGLVAAGEADAYQVRGLPADAGNPRAVALNTTDGSLRTTGYRPAGAASAIDNCLSRAEWGADESLRFDDDGNEIWPPAFYAPQVMTVHHTATQNDDPDPAATVRAIYEYHTVDQGWGDIGYHMLIDEQGRVYEGRWSGETSTPCSEGGDGLDFAHETTDDSSDLVTAAHTGGYNSGNFGVALLGEFTTHPRFGGEPKQAAVDGLVEVLAEFASRHVLDPHATVTYVNPITGDTKEVDMISGHRDWKSTQCPGELLYQDLPEIRDAVAARMTAVSVSLTSPSDGATVSGSVNVSADTSNSVTQVEFLVDETNIGTDTDGSNGWSVHWDSTTVGDGSHTVTATATDDAGQTASDAVNVTVDNVDDPPTVTITHPADGATVSGTVTVTADASDDDGITQVEFFVDGTGIRVDTDGSDGWSASWDTTAYADETHTVGVTTTDTVGQTATDSISVIVDNSVVPIHVGDLDGVFVNQGSTWRADVTVTVHNARHNPVERVRVSATWTHNGTSYTGVCETDADGQCMVSSDSIHKRLSEVTFTVDDLSGDNVSYDSSANHDPDGDSDGTSITVFKQS